LSYLIPGYSVSMSTVADKMLPGINTITKDTASIYPDTTIPPLPDGQTTDPRRIRTKPYGRGD